MPYKAAADKALAEGNSELAFENVDKFVGGCHKIYLEDENDPDRQRVGMMGYTLGAQYAGKILANGFNFEAYDLGDACADAAVMCAKEMLDEKQDPPEAMKFVGVYTKALTFGRSEVVEEYKDEAAHWVAMLLKYAPNNSEVKTLCQQYQQALEQSYPMQEWVEKNIKK